VNYYFALIFSFFKASIVALALLSLFLEPERIEPKDQVHGIEFLVLDGVVITDLTVPPKKILLRINN